MNEQRERMRNEAMGQLRSVLISVAKDQGLDEKEFLRKYLTLVERTGPKVQGFLTNTSPA